MDDFVNLKEQFNLKPETELLKLNPKLKWGLWYPLDPSEYNGYWGFRPYKGLWKHINPWWYYPYPYPTPINYLQDSCTLITPE